MSMTIRIAMLFALPQEYGYFKRLTAHWLLTRREPFKSLVRRLPDQEVILLESGMGCDRMLKALEWLLGWTRPDLVIAGGFAGSLVQDLRVGDVCLGEAFSPYDVQFDSRDTARVDLELSERMMHFCDQHRMRKTHIVTVERPTAKRLMSQELGNGSWIMDMEGYFVAKFCYQNHLPFLAIRAVSDGFGDEIDFDLEAISDAQGHVKIPLVAASILRDPGLMRSYLHSWKHSITAARSLGKALAGLLDLPSPELRSLIEENRLYV
jgi:adenosylhomocysteine nucleosidase